MSKENRQIKPRLGIMLTESSLTDLSGKSMPLSDGLRFSGLAPKDCLSGRFRLLPIEMSWIGNNMGDVFQSLRSG
jgi:hypothetical protein